MNDMIYGYIKTKLFGTWQFGKIDVLVNFIIQKVFLVRCIPERIERIHFSESLRGFILQKVQASVVERQK